jgi:hypothetical protein
MKRNLIPMVTALAIFSLGACNNGSDETTTTDSSSVTTSTDTAGSGTTVSGSSTTTFDTSANYVDLKSGKTVRLRRDATSGRVRNVEDDSEILWYFNPVTNDTFDVEGNVVNNYLIRENGSYRLDEERWKTKTQSDGDLKAKSPEGEKVKLESDEGEGKVKTADSKVKVKSDGTVKEKKKD